MLANFKKFGVAAAVASALGATGAVQAIEAGIPGDALLIPYVIASTAKNGTVTNTLIGITVASPAQTNVGFVDAAGLQQPGQFTDLSQIINQTGYPVVPVHAGVGTLSPVNAKYNTRTVVIGGNSVTLPDYNSPRCNSAQLHWYFFDQDSIEKADGVINVTCEDFVRFDWNYVLKDYGDELDGMPGYMVISDEATQQTPSRAGGLILHGTAYQIRGNWASQAFIPAVPLVDAPDGTVGDEVQHNVSAFRPIGANPVTAGILLPSITTATQTAHFSLRYFVDPALNGATTFVVWFPETSYARRSAQTVWVYDADEKPISTGTSLPHELNLIEVSPTADPAKPSKPHTAVINAGLTRTSSDNEGVTAIGKAVSTGFVRFDISDFQNAPVSVVVDGNTVSEQSRLTPAVVLSADGTRSCSAVGECSRAGYAFSLIGIGGGAVADQVQTELAHDRGIY